MTRPTLDQMLDLEGERIMEAMKAGNNQDHVSWTAFLEDGSRVRIETPFPDDISAIAKQIALAIVRQQLKAMGAWGYTLAAEAWMSDLEAYPEGLTEEQKKIYRESRPPPNQDPDRIEVLIVMAVTRNGKRSRTWKMIRNARGRLIDFSLYQPDPSADGSDITGPFTELMD